MPLLVRASPQRQPIRFASLLRRSVDQRTDGVAAVGGWAKPEQPYGSRIRHEKRNNDFATISGKRGKPQISAAPIRQRKPEPTKV